MIIEEGTKELGRYGQSRRFLRNNKIKKALIVFIGKNEYEIVES